MMTTTATTSVHGRAVSPRDRRTAGNGDDGLTLIEVLLAVLLLAIVSGAVFSALLVFSEVAKGNEAERARLAADQVRASSILPSDLRNATTVRAFVCGNDGQLANRPLPELCEENLQATPDAGQPDRDYDEWTVPFASQNEQGLNTSPNQAEWSWVRYRPACSAQTTNSWRNSWPALKLEWQDVKFERDPSDPNELEKTWYYQHEVKYTLEQKPQPGLRGQYFTTPELNQPGDVIDGSEGATTRQDSDMDFDWSEETPLSDQFSNQDTFGVRWEGTVTSPTTGNVEFIVNADDRVRLWVGDVLATATPLIDRWDPANLPSGRVDATAVVPMVQGEAQRIRLEYYSEGDGDSGLSLDWILPSATRDPVPTSALSGGGNCRMKRIERVRRTLTPNDANPNLQQVKLTSTTIADNLAPNRTYLSNNLFTGPMTVDVNDATGETMVNLNQVSIKTPGGETMTDMEVSTMAVTRVDPQADPLVDNTPDFFGGNSDAGTDPPSPTVVVKCATSAQCPGSQPAGTVWPANVPFSQPPGGNLRLRLDASKVVDPDGPIVRYLWSLPGADFDTAQGGLQSSKSETTGVVEAVFPVSNVYNLVLETYDNRGGRGVYLLELNVGVNQAPVFELVSAGVVPGTHFIDYTVKATDPDGADGSSIRYTMTFSDGRGAQVSVAGTSTLTRCGTIGPKASCLAFRKTFPGRGQWTYTLSVTDGLSSRAYSASAPNIPVSVDRHFCRLNAVADTYNVDDDGSNRGNTSQGASTELRLRDFTGIWPVGSYYKDIFMRWEPRINGGGFQTCRDGTPLENSNNPANPWRNSGQGAPWVDINNCKDQGGCHPDLRIYHSGGNNGFERVYVGHEVQRVTSPWNELSVSRNNSPSAVCCLAQGATEDGLDANYVGEFSNWDDDKQAFRDTIVSWFTNPAGNYGLKIKEDSVGEGEDWIFRSREDGNASTRPHIEFYW